MRKILLFLFAITLFAACNPTQNYVKYDESSAYYLNLQGQGFVTPMMSDISVSDQRISFKQVFMNNLTEDEAKQPFTPATVAYMKNYTLTQAAYANNADIIVSPLIDVKTSEDYKTITVTLTGYPACYTNFRKATKEDIELMKACEKMQNLQELNKRGIILPPCPQMGGCNDQECPTVGKKHPVKEVSPVTK